MKRFRLSEAWEKIEKYAIYTVLGVFAVLQMLDLFINSDILDRVINVNTINLFIAVILLYLFLYIDKRLPLQGKSSKGIKTFEHFDEAISYALNDIQNIQQLDIFAHSSDGYYSLLRHQLDNMASLEKIRIIIRNPNSEPFLAHLKNEQAAEYEKNQIKNRIESWTNIARIEKWKNPKTRQAFSNLEIYLYDFDPPFNMMIVDKKLLAFELRKPTQEVWGFISDKVFVITKEDEVGKHFVDEFLDWFEDTKNERSIRLNTIHPQRPQ